MSLSGSVRTPRIKTLSVKRAGSLAIYLTQPIEIAIEIDQQNHKPVRMAIHLNGVYGFKKAQDPVPPACHAKNLDVPSQEKRILQKPNCQLAVGIVFGKHLDVRQGSVAAHGSTSPRVRASTRSPLTCSSLSGRTMVGSR